MKSVPETTAELIVKGDVPVEVSVSVFVVEVSTAMLPKDRLPVLSVSFGFGLTPVPLSAITKVPAFVELLLTVTCPITKPVAVGLNSTCKVTDCVGSRIIGNLGVSRVNPRPMLATEVTVTADVPVEVRIRFFVAAVFTVTSPKLKLSALIVSCGFGSGVPVPLNEITMLSPVDESLLIKSWPLDLPADIGLNCTRKTID